MNVSCWKRRGNWKRASDSFFGNSLFRLRDSDAFSSPRQTTTACFFFVWLSIYEVASAHVADVRLLAYTHSHKYRVESFSTMIRQEKTVVELSGFWLQIDWKNRVSISGFSFFSQATEKLFKMNKTEIVSLYRETRRNCNRSRGERKINLATKTWKWWQQEMFFQAHGLRINGLKFVCVCLLSRIIEQSRKKAWRLLLFDYSLTVISLLIKSSLDSRQRSK